MRVASYRLDDGPSYGVVVEGGIVDCGRQLGGRYPTLRAVLAAGALDEMAAVARDAVPDQPLAALDWLPPIYDPDKFIGVGRNYGAHVAEVNAAKPDYPTPPGNPMLYIRLANSLVGHEGSLVRPQVSTDLDFEGELAVVIGRPGRHIAKTDAMAHVAGYTCFLDGSVRDFQFDHSLSSGKNFTGTGGLGPWIMTADDAGPIADMVLLTRLNGKIMQHAQLDDMIFDVPTLIAYISTFTRLEPGDVISTGTPEGVGFSRTPPIWLKPGDEIEVEITGIGTLRHSVVAET